MSTDRVSGTSEIVGRGWACAHLRFWEIGELLGVSTGREVMRLNMCSSLWIGDGLPVLAVRTWRVARLLSRHAACTPTKDDSMTKPTRLRRPRRASRPIFVSALDGRQDNLDYHLQRPPTGVEGRGECQMSDSMSVAAFIKHQTGASGMKLQKLLYYCQAWHTVWYGKPLFTDVIQAWRHGPVVPAVYFAEKNESAYVPAAPAIDNDEMAAIEAVLSLYNEKSGMWLSKLTHREAPWRHARAGLPEEASSTAEIPASALRAFYGSCSWGQGMAFDEAYIEGLNFIVELPEDEVALLNDPVRLPAEEYLRFMESGDDNVAVD